MGKPGDIRSNWNNVIRSLSRHKGRKYNLGALLRDCRVDSISLDGETLVLPFSNSTNLERIREELEDPASLAQMAEALAKSFGEGCKYRLEMANGQQASQVNKEGSRAASRTPQQSPLVSAALSMGARIIQETYKEE